MKFKAKTNIPESVKKEYGLVISEDTYKILSFANKQYYYQAEEEEFDLYSNNINCEC